MRMRMLNQLVVLLVSLSLVPGTLSWNFPRPAARSFRLNVQTEGEDITRAKE